MTQERRTAEAIYQELRKVRDNYLDRARACARFACPYLLPLDNDGRGGAEEPRKLPYSGLGPQGFNSMASKLSLAFLPATELPFRYIVDEIDAAAEEARLLLDVPEEGRDAAVAEIARQRSAIDQSLARIERGLMIRFEVDGDRPAIHEMAQHLIAAGNALMHDDKDGLQCVTMPHYVIRRRPSGKPAEVVVRDELEVDELSDEARKIVAKHREAESAAPNGDSVSVYTHVTWAKGKVRWHQEVFGEGFGPEGVAKEEESPWIPVRISKMFRQDYSPGYLEMVAAADLQTGDNLSKAVTELAHISAQVRHLCRPGSSAKPEELMKVENGGFGVGNPDDIFTLQVNKLNDMRAAMEALERIDERLKTQFMMTQFRDSERTTATEIQAQVTAANEALGGVYSILVTEFQKPYVARKLARMLRENRLPPLPGIARPVVSVGLGAIGRGADLERLGQFMQALQTFLPPDQVARYIDPSELISRLASTLGQSRDGLVRSREEVAREAQLQAERQQAAELARAGMADPQKLANAAATVSSIGQEAAP